MSFNSTNAGSAALAQMETRLGLPYVFGLHDCSWLTEDGYEHVGIEITRSTFGQYKFKQVPHGTPWILGDLAFILGSDPGPQGEPGHVLAFKGIGRITDYSSVRHHFQAQAGGQLVFLNEPFTGAVGGCRYDYLAPSLVMYHTRPELALPNPPVPPPIVGPSKKGPTPAQLNQCNLVGIPNVSEATLAKKNGFTLWYFGIDGHFHPQVNFKPTGVALFANRNYKKLPSLTTSQILEIGFAA